MRRSEAQTYHESTVEGAADYHMLARAMVWVPILRSASDDYLESLRVDPEPQPWLTFLPMFLQGRADESAANRHDTLQRAPRVSQLLHVVGVLSQDDPVRVAIRTASDMSNCWFQTHDGTAPSLRVAVTRLLIADTRDRQRPDGCDSYAHSNCDAMERFQSAGFKIDDVNERILMNIISDKHNVCPGWVLAAATKRIGRLTR